MIDIPKLVYEVLDKLEKEDSKRKIENSSCEQKLEAQNMFSFTKNRKPPTIGNKKNGSNHHLENNNKSFKDMELILPSTIIYVGTKTIHECSGRGSILRGFTAKMINNVGREELRKLKKCDLCGKIFMSKDRYDRSKSRYLKYQFVVLPSKKRVEFSKKHIIRPTVANEHLNRKIDIKDFLTRVNTFWCTNEKHVVLDINAEIKVLNTLGGIETIEVPAAYCKTCDKYYILETEYWKLEEKGIMLCKVVEQTFWKSHTENDKNKLNQESLLHMMGYNVNAQDDITQSQRQKILELIVDKKILTRIEICSHLDYLIRRSKNRKNFDKALAKWKSDRDYIIHYKVNELKVVINSITKNSYKS